MKGGIQEVIAQINKEFGQLVKNSEGMRMALYCQWFIELIRKKEIMKAMEFAQNYLLEQKDIEIRSVDENMCIKKIPIERLFGLICYENPQKSILKQFLSTEQR